MKNLIIFNVLLFIFCIGTFAQDNLPCPTISVSGPSDLSSIGSTHSFTSNVSGSNLDKIGYFWTVSNGKIIEGQKTFSIRVLPNSEDMTTATVEITGLPENCSRTASASFIICLKPPVISRKLLESYLPLPRIQKAELDILFVELNNDPSATGYILQRFQPSISPLLLVQKFTSLFRGISFRKYPIDRIKFFVTSGNKSSMEMWVSPIGAQSPPFEDVEVLAEITPQNYKQEIAKIFSAKQKNSSEKPKVKN